MSILHPLISMVVLTFLVAIRLGYFAINSVFKGKVHIKQLRVYDGEFPIDYKSARQHYKNMFEITSKINIQTVQKNTTEWQKNTTE